MNTTVKFILTILAFSSAAVHAGNINLGQAAEFNTFIKGNFESSGPDAEGRVAVGGDLTITGGYSFADKNGSANGAEVIVGGNVASENGSIKVHGGPESANGQLIYGGTISGSLGAGTASKTNNSGIDFNAAFAHLNKLSEQLAKATTPNVAKKPEGWWLTFTPSEKNDSNVYVIDITQDELKSGIKIDNTHIAKDALIVFNVKPSGSSTTIDFNISQMDLGTDISTHKQNLAGQSAIDKHILFNFYGVTDLNLNSSVYGSILAPTANIQASTGVVWGHVIANSWKGSMQMNWAPLDVPQGKTPAVSAPSPVALILFIPALFWFRQRHVIKTSQLALVG